MSTEKNNIIMLIKIILYNIKWIGVVVSIVYGFSFVEKATDGDGISFGEEVAMYGFWSSFVITLALFIFKNKWKTISNSILELIYKKQN